ncbi:MAG: hypothetical protein WAM70_03630 [Pyrinomonadaceae bacterium]
MSAAATTEAAQTKPTTITTFFEAGTGDPLTFEWGRQMPENGYLGTVTFRQFQKKPIQVFDREEVRSHGIVLGFSWAYQAQDGSFLCRMFVSAFRDSYVTFSERKKGNWPIPLTVLAPH